MRIVVVIPAYNEASVITTVIAEVQQSGYEDIVVVDDGSTDATYRRAVDAGAHGVRHRLNRGKGAATRTGIEAACTLGADIIVTIDGDGQHVAADIERLCLPILAGLCDAALGCRLRQRGTMPYHRWMANHIANYLTWLIHGLKVTDSQSGLRAFSRKAALMLDTKSDKYEYESEVIREIWRHRLTYAEVPIQVRYTTYSLHKPQRQNFINGLRTVYHMVWDRLV